jgi:pyridoxine 4-dehydrogenase
MHHVNHTRERSPEMKNTTATNAAAAGTTALGADLTVNRMGFGAMRLTGPGIWGEPADPEECRRVLRRAVELGVTFIDTADSYGPEVSERLIAEALHPYPQGLVIGTKGGQVRPGPGRWTPVGRPEQLRQALEGSLRRLKLEGIDLYQFHRPGPMLSKPPPPDSSCPERSPAATTSSRRPCPWRAARLPDRSSN